MRIEWKPKPDIKPYELALALPEFVRLALSHGHDVSAQRYIKTRIEKLPISVQRHFEEVGK